MNIHSRSFTLKTEFSLNQCGFIWVIGLICKITMCSLLDCFNWMRLNWMSSSYFINWFSRFLELKFQCTLYITSNFRHTLHPAGRVHTLLIDLLYNAGKSDKWHAHTEDSNLDLLHETKELYQICFKSVLAANCDHGTFHTRQESSTSIYELPQHSIKWLNISFSI